MPEAFIGVKVVRTAPGLWKLIIIFYLDVADDDHRMRQYGWAELVEFNVFGQEVTLEGTRAVSEVGDIVYEGIKGSESDLYKRKLRVVAHYQVGFPGTPEERTGPEYRARKDLFLGLNEAEEGEQYPTEIVRVGFVVKSGCPVCGGMILARTGENVKCPACGFVSSLTRKLML